MKVEKSTKLTIINLLIAGLFCVTTILLTIYYWPQNNIRKNVKVSINQGESLSVISKKLENKGVITNKKVFELITKIKGLDKSIPIGTFNLKNTNINKDIIEYLVFGVPERKKITILEGWNSKQISNYLSKELNLDYFNFLNALNDKNFISSINIKSESLEGYLYPDTYYFYDGVDKEYVINRLVKEYRSFWNDSNISKANSMNFTQHEVLTLASIIEGEAIYDSERPTISAVYHNRLKIGMKLQADPTVQYIIKDGPRRLLNKDLRIKSPYNTYLHQGLPPGPINSPGYMSLHAALYPGKNDYLYFVAKGDGYHTFSKNEKEHEKAKRAFQRVRRKVKREKSGL